MPLALAWPSRVGGIQRGEEALKVCLPARRNGLSKGQKVKSLQQRAGIVSGRGELTTLHAQLKVPCPFLEGRQESQDLKRKKKKESQDLPCQCQHVDFPHET